MDLAEIQHSIEQLPADQQAELAAWIAHRGTKARTPDRQRKPTPGGATLGPHLQANPHARNGMVRRIETC